MKLQKPFEITARLMPGIQVVDATISVDPKVRMSPDNRRIYHFYIDLPDGRSFEVTDVQSGVGGGKIQEGVKSLLSFLDCVPHDFEPALQEWAEQNSDEIGTARLELEEIKDCVEDEDLTAFKPVLTEQARLAERLGYWASDRDMTYAVMSCMSSDAHNGVPYKPENHYGHAGPDGALVKCIASVKRMAASGAIDEVEDREDLEEIAKQLKTYVINSLRV